LEPSGQTAAKAEAPREHADDLTVIREQTRQCVMLLRQLIEMLLPKGDPDAPKLEDLIAAMVAQQRETLHAVKQVSSDLNALADHVMDASRPAPNGRHAGSGHTHT
jgi:hypothetical protein